MIIIKEKDIKELQKRGFGLDLIGRQLESN